MNIRFFRLAMSPFGHANGLYEQVKNTYPALAEEWENLSEDSLTGLEDVIEFLPEKKYWDYFVQSHANSDFKLSPEAIAWLEKARPSILDAELIFNWAKTRV